MTESYTDVVPAMEYGEAAAEAGYAPERPNTEAALSTGEAWAYWTGERSLETSWSTEVLKDGNEGP